MNLSYSQNTSKSPIIGRFQIWLMVGFTFIVGFLVPVLGFTSNTSNAPNKANLLSTSGNLVYVIASQQLGWQLGR